MSQASLLGARSLAFGNEWDELQAIGKLRVGLHDVTVHQTSDSLWAVLRTGTAGFALRLAYTWGAEFRARAKKVEGALEITVTSALGQHDILLTALENGLRNITDFTPAQRMTFPDWPRDLMMLGADGQPIGSTGSVHAAQRGLNAGLIFLNLNSFGGVLYFQNFTSLQEFFKVVEAAPESCVGGQWPELGYEAPTDIDRPFRAGKKVRLLDTFVVFEEREPRTPQNVCSQFLDLLSRIYPLLDRPDNEPYDWMERAKTTLRHLSRGEQILRHDFGDLYVRPYVGAEYPDSMVQMSLIAALHGYGAWRGRRVPLADRLSHGMRRFFDSDLKTLRRYLPNVGKDKNADEIDAWYLYHPLKNLGHLAHGGEEWARKLFFESLDFGIEAAHRFKYRWPVKYDIRNFDVITQNRKPGDPGQSDVGGIYAYVMLQAHELTGDQTYLDEAEAAIQALSHRTFDLLYQSNLSAFGAIACVWLHQKRAKPEYLAQAGVFLANLLHNSIIWKSEIGAAANYETFMGVTCLHDGPYMAAYECFESYAALREMLQRGRDSLTEPMRMMAAESSRYALDRARFFFPDQLPFDAIAKEFRNGKVIQRLSIPVEDLYADGKPAGSVGQEVYGAGAPFVFCIHAYHRLEGGRGWIFSEYPLVDVVQNGREVTGRIVGPATLSSRFQFIPAKGVSAEAKGDFGKRIGPGEFEVFGGTTFNLTLPE